jgi:hypothetical protein
MTIVRISKYEQEQFEIKDGKLMSIPAGFARTRKLRHPYVYIIGDNIGDNGKFITDVPVEGRLEIY